MIVNWTDKQQVNAFLNYITKAGASDLHLVTDNPPVMRVNGNLTYLEDYPDRLYMEDIGNIIDITFRSKTGSSTILNLVDLDYAYHPSAAIRPDDVRLLSGFRVNGVRDTLGYRVVFRRLDPLPPHYSEIKIPDDFINIIRNCSHGLVLVTGATGSGKSTTLASCIRYLIEEVGNLHIITLEDPVEYKYDQCKKMPNSLAIITQRELSKSMTSFEVALKSALREDPDVIFVGELRNKETIQLALTAAETGHLVLATVHSSSVDSTISRIVQTYPSNEQDSARSLLINSLRCVLTQQLIKNKTGGRIAVRERLEFTPALRSELLLLNNNEIPKVLHEKCIENGTEMAQQLRRLNKDGDITQEELFIQLAKLQIALTDEDNSLTNTVVASSNKQLFDEEE